MLQRRLQALITATVNEEAGESPGFQTLRDTISDSVYFKCSTGGIREKHTHALYNSNQASPFQQTLRETDADGQS
jgi:hypothetical protein